LLVSRDFVLRLRVLFKRAVVSRNLMQHLGTGDTVLLGHNLLVARRAGVLLLTREVVRSLGKLLVGIVNLLIVFGILMWLSGKLMCWLLSVGLLLGNLLRCHLLVLLHRLLLILLIHC